MTLLSFSQGGWATINMPLFRDVPEFFSSWIDFGVASITLEVKLLSTHNLTAAQHLPSVVYTFQVFT